MEFSCAIINTIVLVSILIDDYKISVCVLGLTTYCSSYCFEYTWISFMMDYNLNLDFGIFTSVLLSMATLVKDPGLNQKSASGGGHIFTHIYLQHLSILKI